jgi:hypothetical protein
MVRCPIFICPIARGIRTKKKKIASEVELRFIYVLFPASVEKKFFFWLALIGEEV